MNKYNQINIGDIGLMAFDALKKNRMRTLLASLGIIIGISTLILILGISHGAENLIKGQLDSFGTDTVFIEVKVPNTDAASSGSAIASGVQIKTMKLSDVEGVKKLPNVKESYGAVLAQEKIVYKEKNKKTTIYGTSPSFTLIDQSKVETGRYFSESENNGLTKVAVIGSNIKEELFKNSNPIGQTIRVRNISFRVIGVMEERGTAFFQNYDDYIYIPIKTSQKLLLGYDHLPFFVVQLEDPTYTKQTAEEIRKFLRKEHKIKGNDPEKDDFSLTTTEESQAIIGTVFGAISLLFGGIAAISLIVGGVGIMNIMYVSITERIREIGLRKAIGASNKAILLQFLLEAVLLTLSGGIVGIILGYLLLSGMSALASVAGMETELTVTLFDVLFVVTVTTLFGIIFGVGPAKKAAKMHPIQALRSD